MIQHRSEAPQINAGSMADIAFLLLVFFLITTTIDTETGILAKLPPKVEDPNSAQIPDRNIMEILINADNLIMIEGELVHADDIKSMVKNFILNPSNSMDLPQKTIKEFPLIGPQEVSKQVISLQNDYGTQYSSYILVRDNIVAAYQELRDEAAQRHFGTSYSSLLADNRKEQLNILKDLYPQRISEAEIHR